MRKTILAVLLVGIILAASANPAAAITNGQPDEGRHPAVGALVVKEEGELIVYCTGTLVAPTVLVTAAHCGMGRGSASVTFADQLSLSAPRYTGRFIAHPRFNPAKNDTRDLAVVVFDQPIPNITPALLPVAGELDTLRKGDEFTAAGFGLRGMVRKKSGLYPRLTRGRMAAPSQFEESNRIYLRMRYNAGKGQGGGCYGDSGGPNFLGAGDDETPVLAAITLGGNRLCTDYVLTYRLDTPSAQEFLAGYVQLP